MKKRLCLFCTCCAVKNRTVVPQRSVWSIHCPKMCEAKPSSQHVLLTAPYHQLHSNTASHYPIMDSEILDLVHHICTLHPSLPTIDITCALNNVRSLQIGVSEAIQNSQDDELMPIEETASTCFARATPCKNVLSCPRQVLG